MKYSKEQVEDFHARLKQNVGEDILVYVFVMETRLEQMQIDQAKAIAEQVVMNAITEDDGENKCGECVQLRIDSYDEPGNKVLWESMGYFITLSTETPEEARALYTALLTVKEVETD